MLVEHFNKRSTSLVNVSSALGILLIFVFGEGSIYFPNIDLNSTGRIISNCYILSVTIFAFIAFKTSGFESWS